MMQSLKTMRTAVPAIALAAMLLGAAAQAQGMNANGSLAGGGRSPGPAHVTAEPPFTHFAWHHVVPWTVMRDTWIYLQANNHWDVLESYMKLLNVESPATARAQMQANALAVADAADIHAKLSYPAFNLVEGPEDRNDNPAANVVDRFTVGMSKSERSRQDDLLRLDQAMRPFLVVGAAAPAPTAKQITDLKKVLDELVKSYRRSPAVTFKDSMWTVVTPGREARAAAGAGPRMAVWRKN